MRHEAALERLDRLDAGQAYGHALQMHLSRCASCAAAASLMEGALAAYRDEGRGGEAASADGAAARRAQLVEDRVMAAIRRMPSPQQDFALRDWLLPGAILILSMSLLPLFGKELGFLESLFGAGYALSLFLVLGLLFTGYSAFFIATHLAELQSILEKRGLLPR